MGGSHFLLLACRGASYYAPTAADLLLFSQWKLESEMFTVQETNCRRGEVEFLFQLEKHHLILAHLKLVGQYGGQLHVIMGP